MAALRKLNSERHGCHKERKKKGRKKEKRREERRGEKEEKRVGRVLVEKTKKGSERERERKRERERETDPGEKHRGGEKEGSVNS